MDEKILFVDDDPNVLEGYTRALHKTFDIDTATSGAAGLVMMAKHGPYAVVVSDMEMPLMNGSEFLAQVCEKWPETVRMMLTGHTDIETATAAVNQGHIFRFLTKPCPADVVSSALVAGLNQYRQAVTKNELIEVEPLPNRDGARWSISLGPELLSLLNSKGACVVELFREEAARYMHMDYDLLRGTRIAIAVIPGIKGYSFLCGKEPLTKLLAWLPHKTPDEITKEIRHSGIGVGLLGVLQLLLAQNVFWGWGVLLLLAGLCGVALPGRKVYFLNSVVMLVVGLADLISYSPTGAHAFGGYAATPLAPVLVGGLLLLWVTHQISLTSPNQQLRAARVIRDRHAAFLPSHSRTVQWVTRAVMWASVVFAAYGAAVLVVSASYADTLGTLGGLTSMLPDLAVFGVLALLLSGIVALIQTRKRPAYAEAKVAAQLVIAVVVLSFWGALLNFDPRDPVSFFGHVFTPRLFMLDRPYAWGSMSFFGGLLSKELATFARPYVWISLIICVLAFNHWFTRRVDRELEEQRSQIVP